MEFTQLSITSTNARSTLSLNGFPIAEIDNGVKSLPIDLFLLEDNTITLNVSPEHNAHITLRITAASQGTIIDTTDTAPALLNLDEDVPTEKTYTLTLKTPGKTLGKRFSGETLSQEQALNYAKELAELIQTKDYDHLIPHFQPKFEDYAALYNTTELKLAEEFRVFLQKFTHVFDMNAITVQPYCSGRVYRLLHNNQPFVTALMTNRQYKLHIYIAKVNGRLSVIR